MEAVNFARDKKRLNFNVDKFVEMRLESLPTRIDEWIRKNAKKIADNTYGLVFIDEAKFKGMSDRYIDSLVIQYRHPNIMFNVKSYQTEDGKPLWKFFEYGTKKHMIRPKFKKALRWQKAGGTSFAESSAMDYPTTPQTFMSDTITAGDPIYAFSKGHEVSGIKARGVILRTKRRGYKTFKQKMVRELQKFLDSTNTKVGV